MSVTVIDIFNYGLKADDLGSASLGPFNILM